MLLTIIIPHYNLPKMLLQRCIESIVEQGIATKEYEIIVVDDASLQPPEWIEKQHPETSIRLIKATHGGPGAARNHGIDEAKGEYIQFVDADDMLMPGSPMQACLDTLRKEKPDILRFKHRVFGINEQIRPTAATTPRFGTTTSGAAYMRDNNLSGSPCIYFFRRALAMERAIRFPENTFHEDEEFNTILHYHARTLIDSNALLYCYCTRQGSTTENKTAHFEQKRIENLLNIVERIGKFRNHEHAKANQEQREGIEHKFATLAVDTILNMIFTGMSAKDIHSTCTNRLTPIGIYPLPKATYSIKYRIFRAFANHKCGIKLLKHLLADKKRKKQ